MPYILQGETKIYYETHGSGPPLIFIHAIAAGSGMWRAQVEEFSRSHRVVTFDARGVGRSGPIKGWTHVRSQLTEDVITIMDHLHVEKATLCGVSFGGIVAQNFATKHPERVRALVVVDSYSDSRPMSPSRALWLACVYLGCVSKLFPKPVLSRIMQIYYSRWPAAADYLSEAVSSMRGLDILKTRLAINLVNFPHALNRWEYPVLAVVGESSWPRSITFMKELRQAVPRTRLISVPRSNDPTPLCRPEEFNAVLAEFLEQLDTRASTSGPSAG